MSIITFFTSFHPPYCSISGSCSCQTYCISNENYVLVCYNIRIIYSSLIPMSNIKYLVGAMAVIVLIVVSSFVKSYNNFVVLSKNIDGQWAQVETQYQRRYDLIPNLVSSVKGFMTQEQQVFGAIAEARTRYSGAQTTNDKVGAATQLEGALSRLLVVMENYPELKSDQTIARLMDELAGTENRIAVERGRYNDQVKEYNIQVSQIPGNFVASMFGFKERTMFKAVEQAQTAPKVDLNLQK